MSEPNVLESIGVFWVAVVAWLLFMAAVLHLADRRAAEEFVPQWILGWRPITLAVGAILWPLVLVGLAVRNLPRFAKWLVRKPVA